MAGEIRVPAVGPFVDYIADIVNNLPIIFKVCFRGIKGSFIFSAGGKIIVNIAGMPVMYRFIAGNSGIEAKQGKDDKYGSRQYYKNIPQGYPCRYLKG